VIAAGVGVDLVEVPRVRAMLGDKGAHVFDRLLTPAEAAYCRSRPDPAEHVAVRLAAKEAVYKALQSLPGSRPVGWRDIGVRKLPDGRPEVVLSGRAAELLIPHPGVTIHLSISHSRDVAAAVAILES
jgi:holo-[acyl-carrier protein] synthase